MSKQIVYNPEKNAIYFHNNDIQYRIDFMDLKRSQENFNSHYQLVDGLEQSLISLFSEIDRFEKKWKVLKKAYQKMTTNFEDNQITALISFEVIEFFLMFGAYGQIELGVNLNNIKFTDFKIENERLFDINKADMVSINIVANKLAERFSNSIKNHNVIIKFDSLSFHRPLNNTIETF
jgi:hypothetical protein